MDVQILRGVVVMHGAGHVEIHAAEQIHGGDQVLQIQNGIVVRLKPAQHPDVPLERVDAVPALQAVGPVDGVYFAQLPVGVDERVARDVDRMQRVRGCVEPAEQDGVGVAVAVVVAHQQQGIDAARLLGHGGRRLRGSLLCGRLRGRGEALRAERRFLLLGRTLPDHVHAVERDQHDGRRQREGRQKAYGFGSFVVHHGIPLVLSAASPERAPRENGREAFQNTVFFTKKYRRGPPLLYYCMKKKRALDFNTKKC